jgi:hypothetical protein
MLKGELRDLKIRSIKEKEIIRYCGYKYTNNKEN